MTSWPSPKASQTPAAAYNCAGCNINRHLGTYPMKCFVFILFFTLAGQLVYSQNIAHGYFITQSNDTLDVRIKVPKTMFVDVDIETLQRKMEVAVDSTCSFKKFGPGEIKGYGFYYRNIDYNFVAKPVKGNTSRFFRKVFIGNNASMYVYFNASHGLIGTTDYTYVVEKRNSKDLVLESSLSRKQIRAKLKSYFSDNEAAQLLIDENPISNQHRGSSIQEIVSLIDYTIESPAADPAIAPVVVSPAVGPTLVLRRGE